MNNEEEQDKSEDSDDSEFSLEGEALMEVQVGVHVWSWLVTLTVVCYGNLWSMQHFMKEQP